MTESLHYVDVILPLALPNTYTYQVPEDQVAQVHIGQRVVVQFGKTKMFTALVWRVHQETPKGYSPKFIDSILDEVPLVTAIQQKFWTWLAEYYLCTKGEVMQAALPASLKLESETSVILHPFFDHDMEPLDDDEYMVAEALTSQHELSIKEIQEILGKKTVHPILRRLLEKKVIYLKEELQEGYRPKTESYVKLGPDYHTEASRRELFNELDRAPKQLEMVMQFFHLKTMGSTVSKAEIMRGTGKNYSAFNRLVEKGVFETYVEEVSRLEQITDSQGAELILTESQQQALSEIQSAFDTHDTVLLHGVTGSGKTELYCVLMDAFLKEDKQVLFLLPEIALTSQMIARLKRIFGNAIGVYHSRFNSMERAEIWHHVANGDYKIVLGARSALFLPFKDLGFVIVDEEHDSSYKQYDPAPRYHARDSAIMLAHLHRAKTLLGTATPSLESFFNGETGKYGLVQLKERFGNIQLPEIHILDESKSQRLAEGSAHLTEAMVQAIRQALERNEQVILFRNRRGYAPLLICGTCGFIPQCKQCDVSLTYHRKIEKLKCHYCGYQQEVITVCPACGGHHMRVLGFGTEKIEDELNMLFEDAHIGRLDLDAVKGKFGHQHIIQEFESGQIDILVGTQMVTKGLDFDKVSLVGILQSDQLIRYPDFRSHERAFQLMVQVAGRSGRKGKRGQVLIQARQVGHPIFQWVIRHDFKTFYHHEMAERRQFLYPPVMRIIYLHFRHKEKNLVNKAAYKAYRSLAKQLGSRVYEPVVPTIGRIRNQYLMDILIKYERNATWLQRTKEVVSKTMDQLSADKEVRRVHIYADVDPQ